MTEKNNHKKDNPELIRSLSDNNTVKRTSADNLSDNDWKMLNLVMNNIPQFIFWKDINSVYIGCNKNFAKVAGLNSPDEIAGKTDFDLPWKKEESDYFRECDRRVMDNDKPEFHIIEPQYQADGKQALLDTNKIPLHDDKGNVVGILGTYEDITERKQTEESQKKLNYQLHSLLMAVPDILYFLDSEDRYILVNKEFEKFSGRNSEFILGKTCCKWGSKEHIKECKKGNETARKTRKTFIWDEILTENGNTQYYENAKTPLFNENGDYMGLIGISRDISKRKEVEKIQQVLYNILDATTQTDTIKELLENIHKEIGSLMDAGNFFVALYDKETDRYSFPYFVDAFDEKDPDDLQKLEKGLTEFVRKSKIPVVVNRNEIQQFLDSDKICIIGPRAESWLGVPLLEDNQVTGVIAVQSYTDPKAYTSQHMNILAFVSGHIALAIKRKKATVEKKKLEEQYNRAQKMESMGRMAGAVAHDLNQILTGLVTFPDIVLMDMEEDNPFREQFKKIKESGRRAAAIVEDLLSIARGSIDTSEVVDINDIINECLNSTEIHQLKKKKPGLIIDIGLDPFLKNTSSSKVQILKILNNLINNAAEAMPEGGRILVSSSNREIRTPIKGYEIIPEGEYVRLCVSDIGTGIPDLDIKRIFEPYFSKKVLGRSGSGLGLAVVWNIVKENGGFIDVKSEVGSGTVFYIYLPVIKGKTAKKSKKPEYEKFFGNGERILIIDDEFDQRDAGTTILKKLNYFPSAVSCSDEAIGFLCENKVDLVLLDMILNDGQMDGLGLFKEIKKMNPEQNIIIISGFSASGKIKEIQKYETVGFLRKPYTIEEIGLIVKKELGRNRDSF